MKRSEFRIGCAAVGVFIWLGGLYATIRGLIYEVPQQFHYGVVALVIGVAIFVIALSPMAIHRSRKRGRPHG
ncbi:DUF2964 family protein [Paraburkholderia sp. FT54]|jgi:hypothetical protein|uniref:DUF2964 family protein n=1 Tax=Paraburkholderia sp. FT54 TaxID=3074437 RepID=UPI002877A055|nr:DUF2964 family protein [Paraburkholderia sp. FT54]WNC94151.1 DUF2964 family protein [Paraburkholderia sp. FT54]